MTNGDGRLSALLVDDHELSRVGLRAVLTAQAGIAVVAEAASAADAIAQAARLQPGLVITEAVLPDATGIDVCREVRARVPGARVVVLAEHVDDEAVVAAVRAGADGYLSKRVRAQDLARAIRAVGLGESRLDAASMHTLLERIRRDARMPAGRDVLALTAQERRVLALVAQGKTNKEIGTALGLSEKTVKNYLSHTFEKLNVSRRAQAAVLFVRENGGDPARLRPRELTARSA